MERESEGTGLLGIGRFYDMRRAAKALIFWGVPTALATGALLGVVQASAVITTLVIVLFVVAVVPPILLFAYKRSSTEVGSSPSDNGVIG